MSFSEYAYSRSASGAGRQRHWGGRNPSSGLVWRLLRRSQHLPAGRSMHHQGIVGAIDEVRIPDSPGTACCHFVQRTSLMFMLNPQSASRSVYPRASSGVSHLPPASARTFSRRLLVCHTPCNCIKLLSPLSPLLTYVSFGRVACGFPVPANPHRLAASREGCQDLPPAFQGTTQAILSAPGHGYPLAFTDICCS